MVPQEGSRRSQRIRRPTERAQQSTFISLLLPIRSLKASSLLGSSPKASRRVQLNVESLKPEETPRKGGNGSKYDFRQASKILNLKAPPLL